MGDEATTDTEARAILPEAPPQTRGLRRGGAGDCESSVCAGLPVTSADTERPESALDPRGNTQARGAGVTSRDNCGRAAVITEGEERS